VEKDPESLGRGVAEKWETNKKVWEKGGRGGVRFSATGLVNSGAFERKRLRQKLSESQMVRTVVSEEVSVQRLQEGKEIFPNGVSSKYF